MNHQKHHSCYMLNSVYRIRPTASSSSSTHKIVLTTTSLRNVVAANSSDVLYYEVVTPTWECHRTRVSRLDVKTRGFNLIAEMLNGHPPGDVRGREEDAKRVMALRMYGGGEFRAADDFLHVDMGGEDGSVSSQSDDHGKGKGKSRDEVRELRAWFRAKDGRKYTWFADKERLELMRDDASEKPVAAYHKEKRFLHMLRISQYPYLEVDTDPATIEVLDHVFVSFLLIERLRRERWFS